MDQQSGAHAREREADLVAAGLPPAQAAELAARVGEGGFWTRLVVFFAALLLGLGGYAAALAWLAPRRAPGWTLQATDALATLEPSAYALVAGVPLVAPALAIAASCWLPLLLPRRRREWAYARAARETGDLNRSAAALDRAIGCLSMQVTRLTIAAVAPRGSAAASVVAALAVGGARALLAAVLGAALIAPVELMERRTAGLALEDGVLAGRFAPWREPRLHPWSALASAEIGCGRRGGGDPILIAVFADGYRAALTAATPRDRSYEAYLAAALERVAGTGAPLRARWYLGWRLLDAACLRRWRSVAGPKGVDALDRLGRAQARSREREKASDQALWLTDRARPAVCCMIDSAA